MRRLGTLLALAVLAAGFGCQQTAVVKVQVEGLKIPREYPVVVDVKNWDGNVQIIANGRYSEPEVRAKTRGLTKVKSRTTDDLRTLATVKAVTSEEGGKRMLRVTGSIDGNDPNVALDLQIRLSKAAGIHVINAGGEVEVVGASGPVTIENGLPGRPGGDIQFRSGIPITDSVTLTTTDGKVLYQVGPGSTGDLDIQTAQGMPEVEATAGRLDSIRYTPTRWRGSLEGGTNPIRLRSDRGGVRMVVIADAGSYGREYWDGWPKWPTNRNWMRKLAGE